MKKMSLTLLIIFVLQFTLMPTAQAQSPQQTLNKYIADLQNNPDDNALREKIIKHVLTMKPKPAIPEEATRYMTRGAAAAKAAKNPDDFKDAVQEFEKVLLVAPWLANAYFNLGVAQDGAGMYAEAIASLKLYLVAVPNASDAKKLIYEIEYRQEKAAKESSPEAIAAKQQQEFENWLIKLDSARYTRSFWSDDSGRTITYALSIRGKTLVETSNAFVGGAWGQMHSPCNITGREFVAQRYANINTKYDISEETITVTDFMLNGTTKTEVYSRVR